jgi:hypothetical protein
MLPRIASPRQKKESLGENDVLGASHNEGEWARESKLHVQTPPVRKDPGTLCGGSGSGLDNRVANGTDRYRPGLDWDGGQ